MNDQQKYLDDLREIREIMNRSSRFLSLSGMSGISAGIIALAGAGVAYITVFRGVEFSALGEASLKAGSLAILLAIVLLVLVLSLISGAYFTLKKAKKDNQKIWDPSTRQLLVNLFIPLATGGLLCLLFLWKGSPGMAAPLTLIFYGLALVNASKFTVHDIRSLGLVEILLGLIAIPFINYGLLIWAAGFGILHIMYGIVMQIKYGS